jgi:hypothetical protein
MLNDVACTSVSKIEEFLFIRGPEGNEKRVISIRKAKHT